MPKPFFDYVEHGSYTGSTLKRNCSDLERISIRQRVMVDVSSRDTSTTLLGETIAAPIVLAPVGSLGLQWADGEALACRAAEAAGLPFTLSTFSILSIEDVAETAKKPFWFQLYVMKDRGFVRALLERAWAAGCPTLVLTVDLQVLGERWADTRNGLSVPPRFDAAFLKELALKLPWLLTADAGEALDVRQSARPPFRRGERQRAFRMVADAVRRGALLARRRMDQEPLAGEADRQGRARRRTMRGAAVASGADAIVVSNHGGRQLDGAVSSIAALPGVVEAVGGETEVLMDGGVRTGADVFRAVALGAKAVMIGRAYAWGLGAHGERGVEMALRFLRKELDVTMALAGATSVGEITRDRLVE